MKIITTLFRMMIVSLVCVVSAQAKSKCLSPLDYGLADAKNGIDCYEALLACHQQAVKQGVGVCYRGIDSLYLEIPSYAKGIPLTSYTDFAGVVITVRNNMKDVFLFTMIQPVEEISLEASQIDNGDFKNNKILSSGDYIVIIKDKKPWVEERIGYGYPHFRRDILFVHNGKSENKVIMPYDNRQSEMECHYRRVNEKQKLFRNLHFIRSADSSYKTCLLKVMSEHNFLVKNVSVKTPSDHNLFGDQVFMAEDCTCFTLEDVVVDGTYSRQDKYGYAFGLNNVWNHKALRVKADGKWGVYGTNNVNTASIDQCNINRFDIHCYGRDVYCVNTRFHSLYNQFCSTYGGVKFKNCVFDKSIPYLNASSYNAFVPVDVIFEGCKFYLTKDRNSIVRFSGLTEQINSRKELSLKSLPNVTLKNCKVVTDSDVDIWYVIHPGGVRYKDGLNYISHVKVSIKCDNRTRRKMVVIPSYVRTKSKLKLSVE